MEVLAYCHRLVSFNSSSYSLVMHAVDWNLTLLYFFTLNNSAVKDIWKAVNKVRGFLSRYLQRVDL